jgi:hypothetical protein
VKKYDGKLSFATDAWTSPNHRAYVAVTVHFEHKGEPMAVILDVVEVAKVSHPMFKIENHTFYCLQSHTGINLAIAFAEILKEFGLSDKVTNDLNINLNTNNVP